MDGGINNLRIINIIGLITVLVFNLFDCIIQRVELWQYIAFCLPFFILFIVIYFWRNYKANAFLYAIIGLGTILGNEPGNYSGAAFLIFSIYIFNTKKTNIIISVLVFIFIAAKNIFMDFTIPDTLNLLLVYVLIFIIYYILIHPKKPNIYTGLDEITREIIEYKMAGWSTKAVADKVFLSTDAVQKRISRACAKYEAGNLAQLVYKLMKKGYISQ